MHFKWDKSNLSMIEEEFEEPYPEVQIGAPMHLKKRKKKKEWDYQLSYKSHTWRKKTL